MDVWNSHLDFGNVQSTTSEASFGPIISLSSTNLLLGKKS
jgi:hypothetical protein